MSRKGLKLRAIDAEDLAMISAILQDALVVPTDLALVGGRFGGMLVRFCHEERSRPADAPIRQVKCALSLGTVTAVRLRGIDQRATAPLEVLALSTGEDAETPRHVTLHFAGGGALRIEVERLDLRLEDIGDPWGTSLVPRHGP